MLLCLHFDIYIHFCFNFAWLFLVLKRKEYIRILSSTSMQMFPLKLNTVILKCKERNEPPPPSFPFEWCLSQTSQVFLVMQNTPPHSTAFHRTHTSSLQTQKPGNRNWINYTLSPHLISQWSNRFDLMNSPHFQDAKEKKRFAWVYLTQTLLHSASVGYIWNGATQKLEWKVLSTIISTASGVNSECFF